jgi:hypothetical protein
MILVLLHLLFRVYVSVGTEHLKHEDDDISGIALIGRMAIDDSALMETAHASGR